MSETVPTPKKQKSPGADLGEESMVVRLSRLDRMLELAGEVIIVSSNMNALSHQLTEGVTVDESLSEDAKDLAITSSRISSDLHGLVTDVRTVDMGDLFARFHRLVRDTSRRLGKPVQFAVEGQDVTIDKKISEKIYDPVAHQIRNAIAHGIEDEQARLAQGKDAVGRVMVRVRNLDNSTVIDVIDDGAGIDEDKVRRKIVKMGLADAESAASLSGDALYEYLFRPGFSTVEATSSTSGRGVGMDVIRTILNEIHGETRIESHAGKGTTFSFVLPLVTAVNISDALLVRARNMVFAFPISSVVASLSISKSEVTTTTGKGRSIIYLGSILPLFDLLQVFDEPPVESQGDSLCIIIIEHKRERCAYVVSDFLSPQKIVISEFNEGLQVEGLSGTATLSGRKLGMVVNLPSLFEQTFGVQEAIEAPSGIEETAEENIAEPDAPDAPAWQPDKAEGDLGGAGSEFLQEVESSLRRLSRELLALEEKRDAEMADSVFRIVHSIKGNLTMFGAEKPAAIAHGIETILERARRKMTELDASAFDILFDGSTYLEETVEALLKGERSAEPSQRLLDAIENIHRPVAQTSETEATPIDTDTDQVALDPTGEFYLSSRRREGAPLCQCRVEFTSSDQPDFLMAYLILRRIQRVADVLGTLPAMTDIEAGLCENTILILIAPRDPSPDLLENLGANLKRYYGATHFDATPYA